MQLLKITSVPIEYRYEIEPGRLEMKQSQNPQHELLRDPSELSIRTENIQVRLDSTELRASLNLRTSGAFSRYYAEKGREAAYRAIGENVQSGNQMARIQDGVTIGQIIQQRMLEQPTTYTVFIPATGTNVSWQPPQLSLSYHPGNVAFDWKVMQNLFDYVPGSFQVHITQYPDVQIEYLGGPNYFPPSSADLYDQVRN